jgi:hypothetical protein
VEDLWDLPVTKLDIIYGNLEAELDRLPKKSLLSNSSSQREDIEFKQAIVKHIVEVKLAEAEQATLEKVNSDKKKMLLDILAKKQQSDYENMSTEELKALIETL